MDLWISQKSLYTIPTMANMLKDEHLVVGWKHKDALSKIILVWTNKKRLLSRNRGDHSVVMPRSTWEEAEAIAGVRNLVIDLDKRK